MAEGGSRPKVLCRFFAIHSCYKGDRCPFLHDNSVLESPGPSSSTQTVVNIPCKYFLAGNCNRGSDCRFSHEQPIPPQQMEPVNTYPIPGQWPSNVQVRYAHMEPVVNITQGAPVRYLATQPPRSMINYQVPANANLAIRGQNVVQGHNVSQDGGAMRNDAVHPFSPHTARIRMTL